MAPSEMRRFLKRHQVAYPVALDSTYQVARQYGVPGTPTSYLISRAGKVVGGMTGPGEWGGEAAQRLFTHLLAQAP